jgi:iron complex outermembrane receptor protein
VEDFVRPVVSINTSPHNERAKTSGITYVGNLLKLLLKGCFAIMFAAIATTPATAQARIYHFDIANQTLPQALRIYGEVSGQEIIFTEELVSNKSTASLKGDYTAQAALDKLLQGTGLVAARSASGAVMIRKAGERASSSSLQPPVDAPPSRNISGPSAEASLAEIIVTAQKRAENVRDVPISIIVVSADDLAKRNITSIDDLATAVPGLSIDSDGYQRRIAIRGVSNVFGATGGLTGVYLDEADVTSTAANQLSLATYDLSRVEVLRGPQGTLYGEGSVGGTVRFITNNPVLDRFQMTADVAALFTQGGSPTERLQEVINVPLIDNQLAIRVAGQFEHDGGWIDQPDADLHHINYHDVSDVRTKLLWRPTGQLSLSLMAENHHSNGGNDAGEDSAGNFSQQFDFTTTPRILDKSNIYNFTLTYDFEFARLLNTATYFNQSVDSYNGGKFFYLTGPVGGPNAPFNEYLPLYAQSQTSRGDELRLTSVGTSPWQWTVGGFFRNIQSDTLTAPYYFGLPPTLPPTSPAVPTQNQSKSVSVFADTSYKLWDRLTIDAGVRDFDDGEYQYGPYQSARFHSVDPRFSLDLKLNEQANVYVSAAKGFRSGGFNAPGQPTFGPEQLWTYELGVKTSLLDRQLAVDADVFYSDYKDYVAQGLSSQVGGFPLTISQNAGDAVIKGVEWNVNWRLAENWTVAFNGDYLDSYLKSVNLTNTSAYLLAGDKLGFVYKYQGDVSVERDFKWQTHAGFVRLDYSLQGPSEYRVRIGGPWYFSSSDVIHLLNLHTGIQMNDYLSLGFFAQNLLNDRGFINADTIEQASPRERPRTFGVNFNVKFD